jgi:hypothetical protein
VPTAAASDFEGYDAALQRPRIHHSNRPPGVECLENEDVSFSFGVPGEENMGKDG